MGHLPVVTEQVPTKRTQEGRGRADANLHDIPRKKDYARFGMHIYATTRTDEHIPTKPSMPEGQ